MTAVDMSFSRKQPSTMSPEEFISFMPRIVVTNILPNGTLELYVRTWGFRVSFTPETPEALWAWMHLYASDPLAALMELGFDPPWRKAKPEPDRKPTIHITLADLDL